MAADVGRGDPLRGPRRFSSQTMSLDAFEQLSRFTVEAASLALDWPGVEGKRMGKK